MVHFGVEGLRGLEVEWSKAQRDSSGGVSIRLCYAKVGAICLKPQDR